jgi:hypothetical protein
LAKLKSSHVCSYNKYISIGHWVLIMKLGNSNGKCGGLIHSAMHKDFLPVMVLWIIHLNLLLI